MGADTTYDPYESLRREILRMLVAERGMTPGEAQNYYDEVFDPVFQSQRRNQTLEQYHESQKAEPFVYRDYVFRRQGSNPRRESFGQKLKRRGGF